MSFKPPFARMRQIEMITPREAEIVVAPPVAPPVPPLSTTLSVDLSVNPPVTLPTENAISSEVEKALTSIEKESTLIQEVPQKVISDVISDFQEPEPATKVTNPPSSNLESTEIAPVEVSPLLEIEIPVTPPVTLSVAPPVEVPVTLPNETSGTSEISKTSEISSAPAKLKKGKSKKTSKKNMKKN